MDRAWFESMLTAHFRGSNGDQDPSWYALRNTVFAYGCRITLTATESYTNAVEASVALLENALSVQPDILQCPSSLTSVRALLLMV